MNNFVKTVKAGFTNIKELFCVLLNDDENENKNNYDSYINGNDKSLAKTAQQLKDLEEKQEAKRLTLFSIKKAPNIKED